MKARSRRRPWGLDGLLDATIPQTCIGCGRWIPGARGRSCERCNKRLKRLATLPYCRSCGRTVNPISLTADGCRACRSERAWNFAGLARVGPYERLLRDLVLRVKYGGDVRAAVELADRLAAALGETPWFRDVGALVPVPMHWLRRWQRPLNHAALLTELVAKQTGKRVISAVRRVRYAPSQTGLAVRAQRFENVRDCFAPAASISAADRALLMGAAVCMIDNFAGSGATLHEVGEALRRMGAKTIYAAVVARTVVPGDWQAEAEALTPQAPANESAAGDDLDEPI